MLTAAMTRADDIRIIINPASAAGRTAKRIPAILRDLARALAGGFTPLLTRAPGHATALAAKAVCDGVTMIVAVGGDGTIN